MVVRVWAASWGPVDTRWHVVRRDGGGALPSVCGAWVYGPVFLRRTACPQGVADREVCPVCALRVEVAVPRAAGLFACRPDPIAPVDGIVGSGVLPEPVVWPTADPDSPVRKRGRHGRQRLACLGLGRIAA
ncbi:MULTISPECIES: hypothetical protein [unclassified Saccharopolyspora]|uniref:hypothetical protein n=1 Tax=unclassified Saccharopolyspora TaxID=2646250 RepID=UPI001CD2547B|nr:MULTISPECIES: hypothetical protein [unclassified Saccharopolyspora]MCA1185109.1 hypothetical protein [Saccharopolyspora sp. 6T]MCA1191415.1 hypothetical protein [Saccharopolyspora sp. 6V]MCA1224984.1 hypothetical protein [Saccharopolyspora sp. 6M]MCA1278525.1 hypothetical protein [Saccharopolyspora sp. 7B]